ncbi:helix-hairpin-helix domain-containing protein [Daejeonella sp.]|uniref:helix-hairpin-helix domain-containing protein n=1 Tax=Daejeonella sp. TaxID=2805397 RepID=UPI0025C34475|nr:helix-hairpin-helix domain-containing protein [Daejeonella sp.]
MNFKGKCLLFMVWAMFFSPQVGLSQDESSEIIDQILELVSRDPDEDLDYSELVERLNFYKLHPLDLNRASSEQLRELFFLSPLQINEILNHRSQNGSFMDKLELQSLQSLDPEIISLLLNFVKVGIYSPLQNLSAKKLFQKGNHDLILRMGQIIQPQAGFMSADSSKPANYSGSPLKLLTRYRFNYSNTLAASLNMEKDAGELFLDRNRNEGFDFYSGSISYRGQGLLKKLVLGDYGLQFGQGLSMWSGSGFGKGVGITTIAKQDFGLKPYSSVNEASFLRGASATFGLKKISFTPFVSKKNLDASLGSSGSEIASVNISGLHRTKTEIENKNRLYSIVYGTNIQYNTRNLNLGLTAYQTKFSMPFGAGKSLYEKYEFQGNSLTNLGFHYDYALKNTYFFGEMAYSLNSGYGLINGLMTSLSSRVSLVLLHRKYTKNYHSFFNQSVSEASNAVNESGFYAAMALKFDSKWDLFVYSDFFKFPWLKFRVDAPSSGYELLAQLNYKMNKKFKISARFKQQLREENGADLDGFGLEAVDKQNYRLELIYALNDQFTLRNRAEVVRFEKGFLNHETGFLLYQDIIYKPLSSKLSGNLRFGIFDTQSFNSRIYAYENDVLYSYAVPAYQGRGTRFYGNVRYTFFRGFDLWLRYAQTSYYGQETVGSGNDEINGNNRSDVRLQVRFQF